MPWPQRSISALAPEGHSILGPNKAFDPWPQRGISALALAEHYSLGPGRALQPWPQQSIAALAPAGHCSLGPSGAFQPWPQQGITPLAPAKHFSLGPNGAFQPLPQGSISIPLLSLREFPFLRQFQPHLTVNFPHFLPCSLPYLPPCCEHWLWTVGPFLLSSCQFCLFPYDSYAPIFVIPIFFLLSTFRHAMSIGSGLLTP